jgi:type VI secretion system protein ImpA
VRNPVALFGTAAPIDISALTAPLDGPGGTGPDLRFDPAYKAIGEARREENARLPQGVWTRDVKRADWATVEHLCSDILVGRSKDLQVACWLAEALLHRIGFAGLPPGLELLTALCERFWHDLHPAIDQDDLGARLAPFDWINARFPALLRNLPVVRSANNHEQTYTLTDYANAQLLEGLRQRDPKSVERSEAAGAVTLAGFVAVRERTDMRFWAENKTSLQAAKAALKALNEALEKACGREAPGLGAIGDAIEDILNLTAAALSSRRPEPFSLLRRTAGDQASPDIRPAMLIGQPPPVASQSREDAYAQLAKLAEVLHRLEPHSPVPYLIRSAVAWGNISLAELVMIFSNAGLDVGKVFEVLGLTNSAEYTPDFETAQPKD